MNCHYWSRHEKCDHYPSSECRRKLATMKAKCRSSQRKDAYAKPLEAHGRSEFEAWRRRHRTLRPENRPFAIGPRPRRQSPRRREAIRHLRSDRQSRLAPIQLPPVEMGRSWPAEARAIQGTVGSGPGARDLPAPPRRHRPQSLAPLEDRQVHGHNVLCGEEDTICTSDAEEPHSLSGEGGRASEKVLLER